MNKRSERTKALRVLQSGVVLAVAGIGAGCSSDVTRFDSFYTSSIPTAPVGGGTSGPLYPSAPLGSSAAESDPYNASASQQAVRTADMPASSTVSREPLSAPGRYDAAATAPVRQASLGVPQATSNQLVNDMRPRDPEPSASGNLAANGRYESDTNNSRNSVVIVQNGDTLAGISRKYRVSMSALAQANGISDPSRIRVGQKLVIPANGSGAALEPSRVASLQSSGQPAKRDAPSRQPDKGAAIEPRAAHIRGNAETSDASNLAGTTGQGGSYTVAEGDSLWGIAHRHGVTVDALRQANGIEGTNGIRIGQILRIPQAGTVQVAKAEPKSDTNSMSDGKNVGETNVSSSKLPSYTPPQKTDDAIKETDKQVVASAPVSTGVGKMRGPARGRIISNYGQAQGSSTNDGIDISVPRGTPIKAAENGVVIYSGDGLKRFGNTVLVRHEDGLVTVYGNASELKVQRGERVRRGQDIALSGMTGDAETPRVHFEVRKESEPVNPLQYLE
jgi:murein DD-endopeptidase MepM/ murein hydrolase activator NlpD